MKVRDRKRRDQHYKIRMYSCDHRSKEWKRARPGILSWHRLHRSIEKAKSLDSYQHRTLGTSRRHGVHHHTTPFHSTASEAPLSLPRRAILALWGSTSKNRILHFYIFTFLQRNGFLHIISVSKNPLIKLLYIIL